MERVAALFEVLKALNLPEEIVTRFYPEIFDDIKKHDPEDKTGIRRREATRKLIGGLQEKVRPLVAQKKYGEAIAEFDAFLKSNTLDPENIQMVMISKARMHAERGNTDEAIKVLDEAIKVAPASRVAKRCAELKRDYQKKQAQPVKAGN
jgi:tetratricopeptide (TPR) repeat protein